MSGNLCTPGLVVSMPRPAGTVTFWPFTNTSRCAWTWNCSCSAFSGTSPAARVRAIGSDGAGHSIVDGAFLADDDPDEHPVPASAQTAINTPIVLAPPIVPPGSPAA